MIYNLGEKLVEETGWYPLPLGWRLGSVDRSNLYRSQVSWLSRESNYFQGRITTVSNAVNSEGGCSIRLVIGNQSLLLDTGLPDALTMCENDSLVVLSHTHLDHVGGYLGGRLDAQIIMSEVSDRLLAIRNPGGTHAATRLIAEPGTVYKLGSHLYIHPVLCPHSPGALCYEIYDDKTSVFFTGDILLESARHDFTMELSEWISRNAQRSKYLLLDATMAGRAHGAGRDNLAELLIEALSDVEDIVIVGESPDHLLCAYLDLYRHNNSTKYRYTYQYIASSKLRPIFELLHTEYIKGHHQIKWVARLDPRLPA